MWWGTWLLKITNSLIKPHPAPLEATGRGGFESVRIITLCKYRRLLSWLHLLALSPLFVQLILNFQPILTCSCLMLIIVCVPVSLDP